MRSGWNPATNVNSLTPGFPRISVPGLPRWFVPQASLDALTAKLGDYGPSGRRVDFLVNAPFGSPFIVEIDGPQHQDSSSPDDERDQMLAKVGIEVVRIPTYEIELGHGANLERVRALWTSHPKVSDKRTADAVMVPPSIHRLVIALLDGVDAGFLSGRTWVVEVEGDPEVWLPPSLWPYVRLFKAMDHLWGPSVMPDEILLKTRRGWARFDTGNLRATCGLRISRMWSPTSGHTPTTPSNRLRHARTP